MKQIVSSLPSALVAQGWIAPVSWARLLLSILLLVMCGNVRIGLTDR
ncbi:MAG: hypothetical protein OEW29_06725 [Acidimicrobiia bacterium]|nr:hypothetical protein [Acidimicrobiia bacterium]